MEGFNPIVYLGEERTTSIMSKCDNGRWVRLEDVIKKLREILDEEEE